MIQDPTDFLESRFDFNEFVRNARIGYAELCGRREALEATIASASEELVSVRDQIEKLEKVLDSSGIEAEPSLARPRTSYVSATTNQVIEELRENLSSRSEIHPEAAIISLVISKLPDAKPKSISVALFRMVQQQKLIRSGKRGDYAYQIPLSQSEVIETLTTPAGPRTSDAGRDGYTG